MILIKISFYVLKEYSLTTPPFEVGLKVILELEEGFKMSSLSKLKDENLM